MRSWRTHAYGEPEQMRWEEVSDPAPGPGEVRVRVQAAGVNFFDLLQIRGQYQSKPDFPFTIGAEAAGVVDAVGKGVNAPAVGDRVLALPQRGGYAEAVCAQAERAFPMPDSLSFPEAVGLGIVYQTAWFALRYRDDLRQGETLLVHAGASGVGSAAIQIGKAVGARVLATAGSEEKRAFSRAMGADETLDYAAEGWHERVKELTGGRGVDVVYDPVGGDVFHFSTKCIAPEGRLLVIGFASGRIPEIAANRILLKNMSVVGVFWGGRGLKDQQHASHAHREIMRWYEEGAIHPPVDTSFALEQAPEALRALEARRICGKLALRVEADPSREHV